MQPLSPPLFAVLSGFLRDRLGLHYDVEHRPIFEDRIATRAQDAGFTSLLDYYYHLRYDERAEEELAALADALVVNETYFFREHDQLVAIADHVIAPLVAEGRRARVWSAACASGEEPLSLAMLLDARGLLDRVELVASDLSSRVLARAREGRWNARALRSVPDPALAARYLESSDGTIRVAARLRDAIEWRRINLVDDAQVAAAGTFDVILCRNVLIYFDDDTVRRVVTGLAANLRAGGHLFVGVAESLLRYGTALVCEERGGAFCYRRPDR
jgi:chemotaxis protein methyltransferase CheR